MVSRISFLLVLLSLAAPALAQDGDSAAGQQRRFRRAPQDGQAAQDGRGGGGGRWIQGMNDRLARDLGLDEQQRAQFDEIAAKQREEMRERMRASRESGDQSADGQGAPGPDGQGGGQFGGPRGMRMMGEAMNDFFDQIEPILHEDQLSKLDDVRDRMERRAADMRLPQELREDLNLDEGQTEQYNQVLEGIRQQRRERFEAARPMWEEMRAAQESGDEQRIAAAQAKMDEMRGGEEDFRAQFLAQIEPFLRDDQRQVLEQYRDQPGSGKDAAGNGADYRNILKAAKRAKLNADQAKRLKDIEREASRMARSQRDPEAKAMLAASVTEDVRKLLTPEQMPRFEMALERFNKPRGK